MNTINTCEQISDALIDAAELPPEAAAHLTTCESCREMRRQLLALRQVTTLLEKPSAKLRKKVLEGITKPPSPPEPSWWETLEKWLLSPSLAIALVFLVIAGDLGYRMTRPSPPLSHEQQSGPLAKNHPSQVQEMAANTSFHMLDKSRLEAVSSATLNVFERGFTLHSGEVTAYVEPGPATFSAKTPHGTVLVLGTIFSIKVSSDGSDVKVLQGKVRVIPLSGEAKTLVAGDEARMVSSFPRLASGGEKIHIAPATGDTD